MAGLTGLSSLLHFTSIMSGHQSKKSKTLENFSFPLYLHGTANDKARIFEQISIVRTVIRPGCRVTNLEMMEKLLNFWLQHHTASDPNSSASATPLPTRQQDIGRPPAFVMLDKDKSEGENMHLISATAMKNLELVYNHHSSHCTGKLVIDNNNITVSGFWNRFLLSCTHDVCKVYGREKVKWSSSAYISPTETFINQRMLHASQVSGILPSQLEMFTQTANIYCGLSRFLRPSSTSCSRYISSVLQVG